MKCYNCEVNEEEFNKVKAELIHEPLNLMHIGRIFGHEFWALMILAQTNININSKGETKIEIILPRGE